MQMILVLIIRISSLQFLWMLLFQLLKKDLESVEQVVNSVRAFVRHPLGAIYFVSPESQRIEIGKTHECYICTRRWPCHPFEKWFQ